MQMRKLLGFLQDELGATSIEYALIAVGISIVIVASANNALAQVQSGVQSGVQGGVQSGDQGGAAQSN